MGKIVHNKLVRDLIPNLLTLKNIYPKVRILGSKDYKSELRKKLVEESAEYFGATKKTDRLEELADVQEVVLALAALDGCSAEKLEEIRARKAREKGAFKNKIFLFETNE